tara:strand:- start:6192 stop:7037 length:846 start_codon:yes stop_codon:yes gene_type:complete
MILIADSGSTKCHWVLCDQKEIILKCVTIGFNPFFIDSSKILSNLKKSELKKYKNEIRTVFFYGAGCSMKSKNKIIENAFSKFFLKADINIDHDINAACYAMCDNNESINCILGTGSNIAYYDGKKILENKPSIGYLIGDEASGNYFGKKILNLYFNKQLDKKLELEFKSTYELDWPHVMNKLYKKERVNVYLASFFPFIYKNKKHKVIKKIINKGLNDFFTLHILPYKNYKNISINFIGSVAYFLEYEIREIAKKYNCKINYIEQHPIDRLVDFHLKNLK